jgi:hypothetical protein
MMMRIFRGPAVTSLLAVALLFSGCGSNSGSDLTKAGLVKQGNAICHKRRQQRMRAYTKAEPKESEVERFLVENSIPPYRAMIKELRELRTPTGEAGKLASVLDAMEAAAAKAEQNFVAANPSIIKANDEVRAYGLTECKF